MDIKKHEGTELLKAQKIKNLSLQHSQWRVIETNTPQFRQFQTYTKYQHVCVLQSEPAFAAFSSRWVSVSVILKGDMI